jgi:hypothetical protein
MDERKETMKKILREGFLNFSGYTTDEIDMKKLDKAPYQPKKFRRVSREERATISMPANKVKLDFHRQFSEQEFERISCGLNPIDLDEKWFIFQEHQSICFHQSWTGECLYVLHMKKGENYIFVKEAWMNPELKFDNTYAIRFLEYLIDRLLLSKAVSFPFPEHIVDPMERAFFRYGKVGSSLANDE